MANNNKPKFDLPWGTLLPLLAVLAGVIATYKPLVSERPSVPSEKTAPVIAAQDVDARLWQDPIGVAQKQKAVLDEQIDKGVAKKGATELHDIAALAQLLGDRVKTFHDPDQKNVLLLAVTLDAGPYSEQAESRLRARQAVLEGLSESGFAPVDGEHIGFVTANWPIQPEDVQPPWLLPPADCAPPPPVQRALLLPWEECEAIEAPQNVFPHGTKRVIVVWLPAVNFSPYPLRYFADLIDQLAPGEIRAKIDVKLIGPANSTGLQNMVREVQWHRHCLSTQMQNALRGVSIISPRATASDLTLLSAADNPAPSPSPRATPYEFVKDFLEKEISEPCGAIDQETGAALRCPLGVKFQRTIAPDDWVLREIIAELARRRVPVVSHVTSDGHPISKVAHVVILSEWDTPYGRSLGTTFAAEASWQNANDLIEHPNKRPLWIHSYHYLRGIDGRLPGDVGKDDQREQAQKTQLGQNTVAIETTEGLNQSDYLRRLARQLKDDNARWQREDRSGIRAIGLLGSDIYDKLMILRALRPQFPDAVFFTNNYDAHFERRDDWDNTHNLVIVSPFGSTLPEIYVQQHIAPFRDNNQTSMYVGTLVATGRMSGEEADCLTWQPRVFEVSRRDAYDLSSPWYIWRPSDLKFAIEKNYRKEEKEKTWFREWLTPGVIWALIIIALMVLAMAAWISVTIARRTLPGGGTAVERLKRALVSTIFWLVCGGPLIVFSVAMLAQYKGADIARYKLGSPATSDYLTKLDQIAAVAEEPLAFFSGISIWPTEMLRLIAFMLAIFFMFKASFDLRANAKKIEAEFSFAPLRLTPFRWRDLGIGFEQWQTREPPPTKRFSAEEAWHAYLCRSKFWPRFIRIGILFALYSIFAFTILHLFPQPPPPARGQVAFGIDNIVFYLAGIGLLLLSFYVVDAIQLNSNFIRMFGREVTKWGREVVDRSHRRPPLTEEELSAYHEIFFVAQRTQVVAPLIWYPLLVLTLIVVARASFFDNWTWPGSLLLIYAITAAWALGSAILLRRAAEQLRETALNDLRRFRLLGQESEAKRQTFDELMAEIRNLKMGAFAPLSDQPFIRAVLFPGAAVGLLAVGQRLFDIF
jgi:hypothetical protein